MEKVRFEFKNLYVHYVMTVYKRAPMINGEVRSELEKYIQGIVKNNDGLVYAIYANPDHVHMLVSKSSDISDETLINRVAEASETLMKEKFGIKTFRWQRTASAFSVSKSDIDKVCKYILNQKEHHKKITWEEEYQKFLYHYQKTLTRR